MKDILKTTLLEFEKSAFVIDLVEHDNAKKYICILQSIQDEDTKREIKINPSILSEFIEVLHSYQELISKDVEDKNLYQKTLKKSDRVEIQKRYLKGISIADLTVQFDCKAELIEQVLRNSNIEIVSDKPPRTYQRKNYKRKKR